MKAIRRSVTVYRKCPKCQSLGVPLKAVESFIRHPASRRRGFTPAWREKYRLFDLLGQRIDLTLPRSHCDDCGIDRISRHIEPDKE